jgi:uncharacterized membrane protein YqaE (UPF0057 family)
MPYLLAVIFPPVAVLLFGSTKQALLNVLLTLCFWVPGVIHALLIAQGQFANQPGNVVREMRRHRLNSVIRRL